MHRAFFTFAAFVTGSMMEGCPGHLVHLVNSATKRCPSCAAISSSSNSNSVSFIRIHYPTGRRRLVHHQPSPPSCRRSRPLLKVCHRKISQCSPNKDGERRLYTNLRPHTLSNWSPPSCYRSRPQDHRSRPRSRPRLTLSPPAASLVVPTISSTFSSKSAIAKFRNARQTKMADVDSNIQHRHVTLKNHCT